MNEGGGPQSLDGREGVLCRAAHSPDCQLPFDLQPTKGGCECAEQADSNRIDTCWLVL